MKKEKFLSTKEVAEALGISESGLRYYLNKYPEVRRIAIEEKKIKRVLLKWPPDAPERIKKIIEGSGG